MDPDEIPWMSEQSAFRRGLSDRQRKVPPIIHATGSFRKASLRQDMWKVSKDLRITTQVGL